MTALNLGINDANETVRSLDKNNHETPKNFKRTLIRTAYLLYFPATPRFIFLKIPLSRHGGKKLSLSCHKKFHIPDTFLDGGKVEF